MIINPVPWVLFAQLQLQLLPRLLRLVRQHLLPALHCYLCWFRAPLYNYASLFLLFLALFSFFFLICHLFYGHHQKLCFLSGKPNKFKRKINRKKLYTRFVFFFFFSIIFFLFERQIWIITVERKNPEVVFFFLIFFKL